MIKDISSCYYLLSYLSGMISLVLYYLLHLFLLKIECYSDAVACRSVDSSDARVFAKLIFFFPPSISYRAISGKANVT